MTDALQAAVNEAIAEVDAADAALKKARAKLRSVLEARDSDYVRPRCVFAVTLEDACGRRRVVGVRASTNRRAWDAAETFYGDRAVALKGEDRSVDLDAGC